MMAPWLRRITRGAVAARSRSWVMRMVCWGRSVIRRVMRWRFQRSSRVVGSSKMMWVGLVMRTAAMARSCF